MQANGVNLFKDFDLEKKGDFLQVWRRGLVDTLALDKERFQLLIGTLPAQELNSNLLLWLADSAPVIAAEVDYLSPARMSRARAYGELVETLLPACEGDALRELLRFYYPRWLRWCAANPMEKGDTAIGRFTQWTLDDDVDAVTVQRGIAYMMSLPYASIARAQTDFYNSSLIPIGDGLDSESVLFPYNFRDSVVVNKPSSPVNIGFDGPGGLSQQLILEPEHWLRIPIVSSWLQNTVSANAMADFQAKLMSAPASLSIKLGSYRLVSCSPGSWFNQQAVSIALRAGETEESKCGGYPQDDKKEVVWQRLLSRPDGLLRRAIGEILLVQECEIQLVSHAGYDSTQVDTLKSLLMDQNATTPAKISWDIDFNLNKGESLGVRFRSRPGCEFAWGVQITGCL